VEGEGGRFRRTHCVPMPAVGSVDELNALLEAWDDADDRRRISSRTMSVGHDWAFERALLRPLPADPFDTALTLTPRVDRYAQVTIGCNQYSVPARFIGHRVRVKLSASAVTVHDKTTVVARHQRAAGKGVKVLDLDHYLEILARKPGALPGATALAQARARHHRRAGRRLGQPGRGRGRSTQSRAAARRPNADRRHTEAAGHQPHRTAPGRAAR
jgi:hypothetical protein